MSNTRRAKPAQASKVYKFSAMQKQAEKKRAEDEAKNGPRKPIPPFRLEISDRQVIEITEPDTLERQLTLAQFVSQWRRGDWDMGSAIPLLQAFCGDEFGSVWPLVKNDPDPATLIELINALFEHFSSVLGDAIEAEDDLPGGSSDSST